MEFRLPVPFIKSDFKLTHSDKLLFLGSCFTENIGNLLRRAGFQTQINPHGIIYNPVSIFKSVAEIHHAKSYTTSDLSRRGEWFFSFNHHGSFSDTAELACLEKVNSAIREAHTSLADTTVVFITLGTSFIYELAGTKNIVANCHKLPGSEFQKRLLSKEEITKAFKEIYTLLPGKAQIIFNVSPVRHWKDGAAENSLSKAILLTAVHEIITHYPNCSYFPAYELMIDDLRDYRFYAKDMLHPNELAIDYIWTRFRETYFPGETNKLIDELMDLRQSIEHRPLFPDSSSYKQFAAEVEKKKADFIKKYPFIRL